eukprot:9244029-Alexandrium_andersonii.AAC.1
MLRPPGHSQLPPYERAQRAPQGEQASGSPYSPQAVRGPESTNALTGRPPDDRQVLHLTSARRPVHRPKPSHRWAPRLRPRGLRRAVPPALP